jgi:hypothetical protein
MAREGENDGMRSLQHFYASLFFCWWGKTGLDGSWTNSDLRSNISVAQPIFSVHYQYFIPIA